VALERLCVSYMRSKLRRGSARLHAHCVEAHAWGSMSTPEGLHRGLVNELRAGHLTGSRFHPSSGCQAPCHVMVLDLRAVCMTRDMSMRVET
jgi:hypothetical protein